MAPSWDFSKISNFPVRRLISPIQAKLKVGAVNDPLEHEADRVADKVMRMPLPQVPAATASPQISRKCESCAQDEESIRRKSASPQAVADPVSGRVHEALHSRGQPMDAATRAYFEPRFRRDFSMVRVHSDTAAEESARELGARAYTVGQDMVFGAGSLAPGTDEGRRLVAHELVHVVQQSRGDLSLQRAPATGVPPPINIRDVIKLLDPSCSYDPGEEAKSRTPKGLLDFDVATAGTYGIDPSDATVVVDFKVDDGSIRPSAAKDLQNLIKLGAFPASSRSSLVVTGYSDCEGLESRNSQLRRQRTDAVAALLPGAQRSPAKFGEYLTDNATPAHRALNRSVIIKDRVPSRVAPTLIPPGPTTPPSPTLIPVQPTNPASPSGPYLPVPPSPSPDV